MYRVVANYCKAGLQTQKKLAWRPNLPDSVEMATFSNSLLQLGRRLDPSLRSTRARSPCVILHCWVPILRPILRSPLLRVKIFILKRDVAFRNRPLAESHASFPASGPAHTPHAAPVIGQTVPLGISGTVAEAQA